jgi:hypothetical protein
MLTIFTVLSPIGLTTLYTASAEPPGATSDVCAAAEALNRATASDSSMQNEAPPHWPCFAKRPNGQTSIGGIPGRRS